MINPNTQPDDTAPFDLAAEPLDTVASLAIDWGGDGSDLNRPVRAHVLAALQPTTAPYAPPLDALLSLGDTFADAEELGIEQEHVPDLVRMARDRALFTAPSDDPRVYAPGHALELLKEFDSSAYAAELVPLLDLDFALVGDSLIDLLGKIGPSALAPLQTYLDDRTRWLWGRSRATDALSELGQTFPATHEAVIAVCSAILERAEDEDEIVVTAAMETLVALKATHAAPLIRHAFELGKVDETMLGPWGEVQQELGLAPDASDPLVAESQRRFDERHARMLTPQSPSASPGEQRQPAPASDATRRKGNDAKKTKAKRKAEKASRKANRKKRK
jgi:hypothetical protein